jgi:penicillin amidase
MRWLRWLGWTLLGIVVLSLAAAGTAWWALNRSLPPLDGAVVAPRLAAEASIERDDRGTPVITAHTRADLAYALGYAHAQDRFFQMDLARRLAAGELSELFGAVALAQDVRTRRFGFRSVARRVVAAAPEGELAIIEAYTHGVNAGLAGLDARPWEYLLLRAAPRAWQAEDSVLVVHSMWWQLQHGSVTAELDRRRLERAAAKLATPEAARDLIAFVYAGYSDWDTPNHGKEICAAECVHPVPGFPFLLKFNGTGQAAGEEPRAPGSNGWAVAGTHTRSGVALIANDMHLDLGVPIVWYPARLKLDDGPMTDITGVTLPGTPAVVAGSNGRVAWGFTNSYGDFSDVRWGPCESADHRIVTERILVRDAPQVEVRFREVDAGVVLDGEEHATDVAAGECAQVAWLATRPEATNFAMLQLERAQTVDDALMLAPRVGIPGQNMVVGDADGRIAWTLFGRVPRGSGPDRLFGALEFRDESDHPRIADPPVGRLWTANQRIVEGPLEAALGDDELEVGAGGYDLGARARQIRDGLVALTHPATEADMLAIQTDARALFLARWRFLLLELLDDEALRDAPARAEFRRLLSEWKPEASADSVGYRLVRAWRGAVQDALWHSLTTGLSGGHFEARRPGQFEAAAWRLARERPPGFAPPGGGEWRGFLLARLDAAIAELVNECGTLAACNHGSRRPVALRHPLSRAVPLLSSLLDMPVSQLPGDHHMPRVQDGTFGASERFAVSPGREDQGYLQLPGGPSGHPLSPFYRSGFDDWAAARPAPFLPGPAAHKLTLRPTPETP